MLFGVIWLDKTFIVPEAVIDKVQAYPMQKSVKEVQPFVRILGSWGTFILHLAHILCPLYHLVKKGHIWDWGAKQQATFEKQEYWSNR